MTIFQFDQCFDDKKIVRKCEDEGRAGILRLPRTLRSAEDPVVLATLLARPHPLVTLDRRIAIDHLSSIPEFHPGLVIVSDDPNSARTMTTSRAARILATFKQLFERWYETPLINSILEITPSAVEVSHVAGGEFTRDVYLPFEMPDWSTRLADALNGNAARQERSV